MATYFVAASGSDITGAGTLASPWATVTHALALSDASDTIYVLDGTSTESVNLGVSSEFDGLGRTVAAYIGQAPVLRSFGGWYRNLHLDGLSFSQQSSWQAPRDCTFTDCAFDATSGTELTCFVMFPGWRGSKSTYGNRFTRCTFKGASEEQTGSDSTGQRRGTVGSVTSTGITATTITATDVDKHILMLSGTGAGRYFRVESVTGTTATLDTSDYATTGISSGDVFNIGPAAVDNVWDDCQIELSASKCFWSQPTTWYSQAHMGDFTLGRMGKTVGFSLWRGAYGNTVQGCDFIGNGAPAYPVNANTSELGVFGIWDRGYEVNDLTGEFGHIPCEPNAHNHYLANTFTDVQAPIVAGIAAEKWVEYGEVAPEYFDAKTAAVQPEYRSMGLVLSGNDLGGGTARLYDVEAAVDGMSVATAVDAPYLTRFLQYTGGEYSSREAGDPTTTTLSAAPPTSVLSTFDGTAITTTWEGLGDFEIRRRFDGGEWSEPVSATSPYVDDDLPDWSTAEYEVRAVVGESVSEWVSGGVVEVPYSLTFALYSVAEPITSEGGSIHLAGSGVLHESNRLISDGGLVHLAGSGVMSANEAPPSEQDVYALTFALYSVAEAFSGTGTLQLDAEGSFTAMDVWPLRGEGVIHLYGEGAFVANNLMAGVGEIALSGSGRFGGPQSYVQPLRGRMSVAPGIRGRMRGE